MRLRWWFVLYAVLASASTFYGWREASQDAEIAAFYKINNQLSRENANLAGLVSDLGHQNVYLADRVSELYLAFRTGCQIIGRYESIADIPLDFFTDPNNHLIVAYEYDVPTERLFITGYGFHCTLARP